MKELCPSVSSCGYLKYTQDACGLLGRSAKPMCA